MSLSCAYERQNKQIKGQSSKKDNIHSREDKQIGKKWSRWCVSIGKPISISISKEATTCQEEQSYWTAKRPMDKCIRNIN